MFGLFRKKEKAPALPRGTDTVNRHFELSNLVETTYTTARADGFVSPAMDRVVALCLEDIALAPAVAEYWPRVHGGGLPRYPSFERLVIIYEKRGDLAAAVDVCDQAIALGFTRGARPQLDLIERRARLAARL